MDELDVLVERPRQRRDKKAIDQILAPLSTAWLFKNGR
jgi:hypothetical protein